MKLHELREKRTTTVNEMRQLLSKSDSEQRALTPAEAKTFDGHKQTIADLEAQIERVEFVESEQRSAAPKDTLNGLEQRISIVDAIQSQIENRALTGALAEYNQEHERRTGKKPHGVAVPSSLFEKRAVQTTTTASDITPDDYRADQFIGLLRESLVVKRLGARVLSNLRGDVVVPRMKTGSTAYWVEENEALTESNQTFGEVRLTPKHVGALTQLSRQLLQQSTPEIEQLVRDDFVQTVSQAVDRAIIAGDGLKEPFGILNTTGIQTENLDAVDWANIQELVSLLELANTNPNAFLIHPSLAKTLRTTLKEAGLAGYLMESGTLAGLPAHATTALDVDQILLGDFSQIIIGQWSGLDVLVNPYAAGVYEKGNVQVRIMTTVGTAVRHPQAFALGTVTE